LAQRVPGVKGFLKKEEGWRRGREEVRLEKEGGKVLARIGGFLSDQWRKGQENIRKKVAWNERE